MPDFQDNTGRRFGRLVATEYVDTGRNAPNGRRVYAWNCVCDCGAELEVAAGNLRSGNTASCGCLRKEVTSATRTKHGMSAGSPKESPEYEVWKGMLARCRNPNHISYQYYGARGIDVCAEWATNFEAFYAYMGPRPSPELTVERMDNDLGYQPGNVRWATRSEQRLNQRRPHAIPA